MRINKTKYSTGAIARWLWNHHKRCRVQAVLNAVIGLAMVGMGLLGVDTVRKLTDIATGSREGSIGWMAALLGAVFFTEMLLHIASTWIAAVLGVKAQNLMQQSFFSRLLKGQWRGVEKYHSGDVLNRLFSDVSDIVTLMTEVVPSTLIVVVQFLASFAYLYVMDRTLAIILVVISPLFVVLSRVYFRQMRRIVRHIKDSNSAIQSIIQESVQHKMVIKTLERTGTMVNRLEQRQGVLRSQIKTRAKFSILSKTLVNIGFAGAYLVALVWGLFQLQGGLITVGVLIAFTQLINRIQRPMLDMARLLPMFVNSMTSAKRLMELEALPLEEEGESVSLTGSVGLRFEDVTFSYQPEVGRSGRMVIRHFSHDFRPGSFTAILGETGAGKTTLIRMMLALVEPTDGKALIYSADKTCKLAPSLRNNFSYIPQGNTLFSGTIRDNLLLGNPEATAEQMREALRLAMADFVFQLPKGLDTVCSEQGGGLSEGQSQRIAIARALLRPCKVLLLDEATSALDMQTEQALLHNLKTHFADSTIIFVTHRLAVTDFTTDTLTLTRQGD
ncbi:MAG: ABC transporter ATP-binding protein [Bacteroidaceae bacterium]|nr:ABC transporter ATP-binding protein [Bacteroidaceae bacterium]